MTDLSQAAKAAEQAAYAAGTHLMASRSRLSEVLITHKRPRDVVDEIDREAEDLMRGVVLKRFPDYGFLGDGGASPAHDGRPLWIVDPLDGSANYLRGYPQYAVSLALVLEGEPHLGVVYDPCRNEFFGAIRGRGAVLNGTVIRCGPPRPTGEALAATVFPQPTSPRLPVYMGELGRVLRAFGGVRRSGSMALEMAYLAAGRLDAFWVHDLRTWRVAAAALLLRESGALLESRDGEPVLLSRSLVACTPGLRQIFNDLLAAR